MALKIDAHQHFWRPARGDYGWLTPELGPIYRDFLPAELAPMLNAAGIDRTILVQAAPTVMETDWLLDLAEKTPFVAGVVGWADFAAPDAATKIAAFGEHPLLVGLRPMIHDIADPDWMLGAALEPAFAALKAAGLVFDALVKPPHLSRLLTLADRHPDLAIVIDHGAKPPISAGTLDPWLNSWRADMAALAARANITCKLSGLVTEAGNAWDIGKLKPYVAHLLTVFGPDRLIFGSDWPVCTLAASYAAWHDAARALTAHLSAPQQDAIFGGNATRIYLSQRGRA
ncbi:MAG: amidohydrolase [Rhizobiales bacterium PAR1]|nr:MAG: amidohydrolase [Rhizobiales bacterium PAR1]